MIKNACLKEYYHYKQLRKLSPLTHLKIKIEIGLFFRYLSAKGINSILQVDSGIINGYLLMNKNTPFWLTRRKRRPFTIVYKRRLLWNYFEFLFNLKIISSNPVRAVPDLILPKKIPLYLSFRQSVRLLKYIIKNKRAPHQYQIRARAYVALIMFYGLENHEIFKLKLADIDFKRRIIRLRSSAFHDRRILPLLPPVDGWLKDYKRVRPSRKSAIFFQNVKKTTPFGFLTSRGMLNRYSKELNYDVSSKVLRSTFFYNMFNAGVGYRTLQAIVGCHTLKAIVRRSIIDKSAQRKAVEAISL